MGAWGEGDKHAPRRTENAVRFCCGTDLKLRSRPSMSLSPSIFKPGRLPLLRDADNAVRSKF
jgi:hypothetical protein